MAPDVEFTLQISGIDDLDALQPKPALSISPSAFLKKCLEVSLDHLSESLDEIESIRNDDYRAVMLTSISGEPFDAEHVSRAVKAIRGLEREKHRSLFVIMSLVHVTNFVGESFAEQCRIVYSNGIDAILVKAVESSTIVHEIREKGLGLRGRRVRILLDSIDRFSDAAKAADGCIVSSSFSPAAAIDALSRQKLVLTRCAGQSDSLRADMLVCPQEAISTARTTVPSTPAESSPTLRSFLFKELLKFASLSTRLIVCISDDGLSASELSVQSRLAAPWRLPPILALSASESTCRFMGCLYGVVPLQTPSFVSVSAVVANALAFAQERGFVQSGDQIVIVLQPPAVSASTNQSCFEGVVQRRIV